jgi:hypothetical protein
MGRRHLKLNELRRILRSFDVFEDTSRGKRSHTLFYKDFPDGRFTYPVPTHGNDVKDAYANGCRKKFRLRRVDGVSDEDFYGRA